MGIVRKCLGEIVVVSDCRTVVLGCNTMAAAHPAIRASLHLRLGQHRTSFIGDKTTAWLPLQGLSETRLVSSGPAHADFFFFGNWAVTQGYAAVKVAIW